ncbi:uncharacterized protein EI90DRAFT_3030555 [Cantharellus anzutake]|uniref:uncharacterized protein n=1 Tax=Cantharellus anzutake TaxID=1750568 RepID=UPI001907D78A|nr:uncharacterized protein EI90DRAFT_3030555 [Cantharellus anzutake]KAF8342878.1 hypothetical protein EI90DRAFT_3030555 [Cantharellus anzutake]
MKPKVTSGRVLVTGGGGTIGKHVVRRLLAARTPVTILDRIFYEDELELSTLSPSAPSLLQVNIGDIRNTSALSSAFTNDISGVIHLAAVSRADWCTESQKDCSDINERGTQMVLDALIQLNTRDQGRRWFIFASSFDVYHYLSDQPMDERTMTAPVNAYGQTKLAAEKLMIQRLMGGTTLAGRIHAAALRLSTVYGGAYDHLDRLIPSIVTQAISNQVVQMFSGNQQLDLLHIDDCVDALLLTIEYLSRSLNKKSWFPTRTSFEIFNIASGRLVSVDRLVDSLVALTHSKSPIRRIPRNETALVPYKGAIEKARRILGFHPLVNIDTGLLRLVKAYLTRIEYFLRKRMEGTCGEASPSIAINADLEKLHDCHIHIEVNIQGEFQSLMPPPRDDERGWSTDTILPPPSARIYKAGGWTKERQIYSIQSPYDGWWFGVTRPDPGPVQLPRITKEQIDSILPQPVVDWRIEVNPDDDVTLRFVVPDTDLYLMSPTVVGGNFSIVSKKTRDEWPFRISPICCEGPAPWPFLRDDPLDYSVEFQRSSLERPFSASPSRAICNRLERASDKVKRELETLSTEKLKESKGTGMSRLPVEWVDADLPACLNVCDHPTICVDTGDCQCVLSSCLARERRLVPAVSDPASISFPLSGPGETTLGDMVKRSRWQNVLRPLAASFVAANIPFPRVHAASLPEVDRIFNEEHQIHKIQNAHCFSADSQLERAVRLIGIGAGDDAEMTYVPNYQTRNDEILRRYDHALNTVEGFDASRVIVVLTHDWGVCMHFEWAVWKMRENIPNIKPIFRPATLWSVMADLNTACYWPQQYIVIPPRSCSTPKLLRNFLDIANVRPARDRRVLVTFSGSLWGTGFVNRVRLECRREGWRSGETEKRLHPNGPKLRSIFGNTGSYDYMGILNDTIFCPQPAGTTGWATRLVDSIYAGCIPILVGHKSHYPFFDMIDWGKISVRIDASELDRLEDILLSRYTLEDIERLQVNVMLVRDAFVYPLDDVSDDVVKEMMIKNRGPLWFALHSTRMRMLTLFPTET